MTKKEQCEPQNNIQIEIENEDNCSAAYYIV